MPKVLRPTASHSQGIPAAAPTSALSYYGGLLVGARARARLVKLAPTAVVAAALVLCVAGLGDATTWQGATATVGFTTAGLTALVACAAVYLSARRPHPWLDGLPVPVRLLVAFAMLTIVPVLVLALAAPVVIGVVVFRLARRVSRSTHAGGEAAGLPRLGRWYASFRAFAHAYYGRLTSWMWLVLAAASLLTALILMVETTKPSTSHVEVWEWEILLLASPVICAGALLAGGGPRGRWILREFGRALLTLFVLSAVVFLLMGTRGAGDVAHEKFGNQITPAQVDAFAKEFGLDKPLYERYWDWGSRFVIGDMGTSYVTNDSVASDVIPRFEKTLILATVSLLIAIPISVLIGVFQARRLGRLSDSSILTGSVVLAALPEFVIGIALVYVFAVRLGWLPTDSTALEFNASFADTAKAYVLPAATLVIAIVPYVARIARTSAHEALGATYTQAALLRGLSRRTVVWDHAMRNGAVPLVNIVAINIVYLVGGIAVVEYVFAFPGIGQGIVQATQSSDIFKIEAFSVLMGVIFIIISLLADVVVAYLNPRLKEMTTK